MTCRKTITNNQVGFTSEGFVNVTVGDYVRHLIADHWDLLLKVRKAYEDGEITL